MAENPPSSEIAVVYLAYLPYGPALAARFLASYDEHDAGLDHELLVVQKGEGTPLSLRRTPRRPRRCKSIAVPDDRLDLGTYLWVARNFEAPRYLFLNTSSVILGDGWLEKFDRQLSDGIGIVGAMGSHGGSVDLTVPAPNPHIRTTAFMLDRQLMLDLDWHEPVLTKDDAYAAENGSRSITTQILGRGLGAMVVGRDGRGYPVRRWRDSNTFWVGDEANLLVADQPALEYLTVSPDLQREKTRAAWGCCDGC